MTATKNWPADYRYDGPEQPSQLMLLAHGAGAGMDHPFMQQLAETLANEQLGILRFEFDYMVKARALNKRRPPDRLPALVDCYQRWVEAAAINYPDCRLILAGKSMGSRVAALLGEHGLCVVAYGYPFHPLSKKAEWRWQPLEDCPVSSLICQGERDSFGNLAELSQQTLPEKVRLEWLTSGDHSFVPLKRSGLTQSDLICQAASLTHRFLQECN